MAATMCIPVHIDMHFFVKNRLQEHWGSNLPKN